MRGYVPLWCKSNLSFLEGASHPEELVQRCRELAIPALVLADRDGVYGVARAHLAAGGRAPRLIVGAQLTVVDSLDTGETAASPVVLLVQCKEGYANLCRLISRGRLRSPKGERRVSWEEACAHAGGLIALWQGRRLLAGNAAAGWRRRAGLLREAFPGRLYGLVTRHRLPADAAVEHRLTALSRSRAIPLAAATEVLYHHRDRRRLQATELDRAARLISHHDSLPAGHQSDLQENLDYRIVLPANARHANTIPSLRWRPISFVPKTSRRIASGRRCEHPAECRSKPRTCRVSSAPNDWDGVAAAPAGYAGMPRSWY